VDRRRERERERERERGEEGNRRENEKFLPFRGVPFVIF
jgi:hypothetical protein